MSSLNLYKTILAVVSVASIGDWQGFAQTRARGRIEPFEVASIKLHDPKVPAATMRFLPNGNAVVTGVTLRNLLCLTEDLRDYQLSSGPQWFGSELYDIVAKGPARIWR
jgi:hypothetical protein